MTSDPDIIEAASEAMCNAADLSSFWNDGDEAWRVATAIVDAVTPLIRAQVLEEAAQVAEESRYFGLVKVKVLTGAEIAAKLRALKEQP